MQFAFLVRPRKPGTLRNFRFEELIRAPATARRLAYAPLAEHGTVSLQDAARKPFVAYTREEYPDYHMTAEF